MDCSPGGILENRLPPGNEKSHRSRSKDSRKPIARALIAQSLLRILSARRQPYDLYASVPCRYRFSRRYASEPSRWSEHIDGFLTRSWRARNAASERDNLAYSIYPGRSARLSDVSRCGVSSGCKSGAGLEVRPLRGYNVREAWFGAYGIELDGVAMPLHCRRNVSERHAS